MYKYLQTRTLLLQNMNAWDVSLLTVRGKKAKLTIKLAIQLTATAILVAMGRGPWPNNSATKNQGIDPIR